MYGKEFMEWKESQGAPAGVGIRYDMQAHEHDAVARQFQPAKLLSRTERLLGLYERQRRLEAELASVQADIRAITICM